MKKILILLSVLSIGVFASCEIQNGPEEPAAGEQVTIHVSIPATKVALTPDGEGLHLAWQEGDCIRVVSGANSSVFTIKEGFTDHEADFTGTAVEGSTFDIIYPGTAESVIALESSYPGEQVQDGNGSTAHLKYAACLTGVNSYADIAFTPEWAESHHGDMLRPGAIKLQMTLPAGVKGLDMLAVDVAGFNLSLPLVNVDVSESSQVLTAYSMLPFGDVELEAVNSISVRAFAVDEEVYGLTFNLPSDKTLKAGEVSVFKISSGVQSLPFSGGSGTEADPWVISNRHDLMNVRSHLVENEVKYFTQIADIDLAGCEWEPFNNVAPFNKGVNYQGNYFEVKNLKVTSDKAYPSFAGIVYGAINDVVFNNAEIDAGANTAGVLAGYIGTVSKINEVDTPLPGSCSGIKILDSKVTGTKQRLGGMAGYARTVSGEIKECWTMNTTVESGADRVGGLIGQTDKGVVLSMCGAEQATVSGTINVGGLVGVCYGDVFGSVSSGSVCSVNPSAANSTDIAVGGLIGYLENGTVTKSYSEAVIDQTGPGRDVGGFIGKMLAASVSKCYCTGNVTAQYRNVGGFVGLITLTQNTATITDCYCTGDVSSNSYTGGFLGLCEKGTVTISNCFASGSVVGTGFAIGGMAGFIQSADLTMQNCVAWNPQVTATSIGDGNWSSGAVAGVACAVCTLTDNYRSPDMALTAWWVPDAGYDHPNVSSSSPLVVKDKTNGELRPCTATGTSSGQDNYPQFAYHGKSVAAGKTLAKLAQEMGWDGDIVWYLGGVIPNLR